MNVPSVCVISNRSFCKPLETSKDHHHADGNDECWGTDASGEAIGDDSSAISLNGFWVSHDEAPVAMYSEVASQGTGAGKHNVNMQCLLSRQGC
jgi:hypothetical protein